MQGQRKASNTTTSEIVLESLRGADYQWNPFSLKKNW